MSKKMIFIGSKLVASIAMTRQAYNDYRGWQLPEDENGADEGFLVEYLDGGKPNHPEHAGYISWSPKAQHDGGYLAVGEYSEVVHLAPFHQRLLAERVQLADKVAKLGAYMHSEAFAGLDEVMKTARHEQYDGMTTYLRALGVIIEQLNNPLEAAE